MPINCTYSVDSSNQKSFQASGLLR
ncbi:hypothetical protein CP8484711_1538, partial [Chlamydia psittaci 84-8471/1]